MNSDSAFTHSDNSFDEPQLLNVAGTTCDCYCVRLYGKLHFMKKLKAEYRTDPHYIAAQKKEFEIGYSLEHPHLVRYFSREDDYILTEYVDGESLDQFAINNRDYLLQRRNTDRLLRQLLDVVGYLHSHSVVHLDLKPSNILITRVNRDVKLIDLGFCYSDSYPDTKGRTEKYAAPEQRTGDPVDARSDIYALGRVLESLPCSAFYKDIIERCVEPNPDKRFQTVNEILKALDGTRRQPWIIGAVTATVVLLTAGLWITRTDKLAAPMTSAVVSSADTATASAQALPHIAAESETVSHVSQSDNNLSLTAEGASAPVSEKPVLYSDLALYNELRNVAKPHAERIFGTADDSTRYSSKGFHKLSKAFDNAVRPEFQQLWDTKYSKVPGLDKAAYEQVCLNVRIEFNTIAQSGLFKKEGW